MIGLQLSMVVGLGAAAAATALVSVSLVLQATEARRVDRRHALRGTLLIRLLRRRRWVIATLIGYLAFPCQLFALAHAPLVVVQPIHASGLLIVLTAGIVLLRERVGAVEVAGAATMVLGLAAVAYGAPAGAEHELSHALFAATTGVLLLSSLVPYALGPRCGRLTLMLGAGIGFAAAGMAVKGFSDALGSDELVAAGAYLATAGISSTLGTLSQMSAFQRHRAAEVVPISYALANFLPILLGTLLLRERWSTAALAGAPFGLGALMLLLGTITVARARPVVDVVRAAGDHG